MSKVVAVTVVIAIGFLTRTSSAFVSTNATPRIHISTMKKPSTIRLLPARKSRKRSADKMNNVIIESESGEHLNMWLPQDVYIRTAEMKDLKNASNLLTSAFFSMNILTTPFEWLKTYLSLEDTFPKDSNEHFMFVACSRMNDSIIGFCEVDSRVSIKPKAAPRPYMCNLAVGKNWRSRGIAKALIFECERKAHGWGKEYIYLRVRWKNKAAIGLYNSIGYVEQIETGSRKNIKKRSDDDIILLQKQIHYCVSGSSVDESTLKRSIHTEAQI